jgi:acyl-CoA reductase-like NAD-dependent aldehyde dehydrogenase
MAYQSINPNDGNLLARYHDMDGPALEPAPSDAHHCFEVWRRTSYIDRARIVERAAKLLLEDPDGFAGLETLEIGKRIAEARGEVKFSAAILSYYARHTEAFLAPEALEPAAGEAHMENSPLGVIFCVQRWNFPYCQLARVAGPQLMAGNVLLVKHADIAPDNPAFRDEFFGPVASCYRVASEEDAVALANDSDFGLGGSVWTQDAARGSRVASRVDTGMIFVNNLDRADADLPFGGIKHSGYGRELGRMGIQEFVNRKLVRTGRLHAPV